MQNNPLKEWATRKPEKTKKVGRRAGGLPEEESDDRCGGIGGMGCGTEEVRYASESFSRLTANVHPTRCQLITPALESTYRSSHTLFLLHITITKLRHTRCRGKDIAGNCRQRPD